MGIAVIVAMIQLTEMFAALGPGSYFTRLIITQTCGAFFLLCLIGGFAVSGWHVPVNMLYLAFAIAIAASPSAQIFYGMFRVTCNWQIHLESENRSPVFVLKDVFTLTLFAAVALSVVNHSFRMSGSATEVLRLLMAVPVAVSVSTLTFGIPALMTTLRIKSAQNGCIIQLVILAAVTFLAFVFLVAFAAPIEVYAFVVLWFAAISALIWNPLAVFRKSGIVLTRPKDIQD